MLNIFSYTYLLKQLSPELQIMLKILPRYFIREHIGPFFLAIITINLLFILNIVYRELGKFLNKGIALPVILEFLFLNLAWMIALSVPMAVLSATIMAFGRLSADNEITAIKASGISFLQIFPMIVLISAIISGTLIWFNNHVLPDFNHQARLLAMDIARKKPMINLESGVIYTDIPNYNILVEKVTDKDTISFVENIVIYDQNESYIIKTINADTGELSFRQNTGMLEILLFNGEVHEVDINEPETFSKLEFTKQMIKIPMSEIILKRSQSEYRGDREKSAAALLGNVHSNDKKIAERFQTINDRIQKQFATYMSPNNTSPKTIRPILMQHKQLRQQIKVDLDMIKSYKRSNNIFLVEWHKKYSIPVACIIFILVGAPIGILIRQSGWAVAAGLSIGFFLLYWAFLIGGEILADRQKISPFLAMWSPNIVVGSFGIYLVFRTVKEKTSIGWLAFTKKIRFKRAQS